MGRWNKSYYKHAYSKDKKKRIEEREDVADHIEDGTGMIVVDVDDEDDEIFFESEDW